MAAARSTGKGLGQRSFDAKNIFDIFNHGLEEQPKPPRQLDASISRELERSCLRAMMKDRNAPYGSAQNLADELTRTLASG